MAWMNNYASYFTWTWLVVPALISMLVWLISVDKMSPWYQWFIRSIPFYIKLERSWYSLTDLSHVDDGKYPGIKLWGTRLSGTTMLTRIFTIHYDDVIMTTMVSQTTSFAVVYSIVYSGADQRKHQSSASLAFVRGIHRDRWIPCTKGQYRGKCFHLMTSSWILVTHT